MIATGISPPKKLTRPGVAIPGAGKVSDLDERLNSSLRRRHATRKSIPQSVALCPSLARWLTDLGNGWVSPWLVEQVSRQLTILKGILFRDASTKAPPTSQAPGKEAPVIAPSWPPSINFTL